MINYSTDEIYKVLIDNVDSILIVSSKDDRYRAIKRTEGFARFIDAEGSYKDLIEKLLFHLSDSNDRITDTYQVFLPKMGEFKNKFSR